MAGPASVLVLQNHILSCELAKPISDSRKCSRRISCISSGPTGWSDPIESTRDENRNLSLFDLKQDAGLGNGLAAGFNNEMVSQYWELHGMRGEIAD